MRLAAQAVAAQTSQGENIVAGQPLVWPFDPELAPTRATVQRLGTEVEATRLVDRSTPESPRLIDEETHLAGFYVARWEEPGVGERSQLFAASPDVQDVRQERLTPESVQPFLGQLVPKIIQVSPDADDIATEGSELWRHLVMILLGLLAVESCLAPWVGRIR
jgi:hypothetical protein